MSGQKYGFPWARVYIEPRTRTGTTQRLVHSLTAENVAQLTSEAAASSMTEVKSAGSKGGVLVHSTLPHRKIAGYLKARTNCAKRSHLGKVTPRSVRVVRLRNSMRIMAGIALAVTGGNLAKTSAYSLVLHCTSPFAGGGKLEREPQLETNETTGDEISPSPERVQ